MPRPNTQTAEIINEIIGMPPDAQIAPAFLDRFPIDSFTPSPETIAQFLREQGCVAKDPNHAETRAEALSYAVNLAHAYDRDRFTIRERRHIGSPAKMANLLRPMLRDLKYEKLITVALDTKKNVIDAWTSPPSELKRGDQIRKKDIKGIEETFKGTLNASVVHPREIFRFAIEKCADSIILAHNHPSGDPTPSPEDIHATKEIREAGKILQIALVDHIIMGADGTYISLKEEGII